MPKIIKNTILNYIPKNIKIETNINPARIFLLNNNRIKDGNIIYLCERELRLKDNFALQYAIQKSSEYNLDLKIIHNKINYINIQKQKFINDLILETQNTFLAHNLDFRITENLDEYLNKTKLSMIIKDFNPLSENSKLQKYKIPIIEIDGHNIIPARFISDKQEYNAATFRRKVYLKIYPFLTEYNNISNIKTQADYILKDFIENKLNNYFEQKNNPNKNITSGLSKYINLGFISSQRIAIEILKSNTDNINKESFLEELIIRKELADNYCLYNKILSIPQWAEKSLNEHQKDIRPYIYTLKQMEKAKTHDILWNSSQKQLIREGLIHGYLRMYWAKKIFEWSPNYKQAIKTAIYLNDKYAYDAPSSNGYTGILWAIGGVHDRAFQNHPVTGKIRRMTFNSLKKKFNILKYVEKYNV